MVIYIFDSFGLQPSSLTYWLPQRVVIYDFDSFGLQPCSLTLRAWLFETSSHLCGRYLLRHILRIIQAYEFDRLTGIFETLLFERSLFVTEVPTRMPSATFKLTLIWLLQS